ncbi:MAG: hypothetical protein EP347_10685 [Alphaproteobacteria bacterium]|nr:MAG: hypothetical protein EP347_10685 [Alphaproteobacteria bacterium]
MRAIGGSDFSFHEILERDPEAGTTEARLKAVALLYHSLFTGLILMVASRCGDKAVGDWIFKTFRRQHEAKFLSSFDKLGLTDVPHAVASAQYHYLSNSIGGVEVEYMYESDTKAWVRFCHPRWLYDGTAICGVPESVSHGFLRGWYGQNGVSLSNPRLGFVCTSQDMTAEYGLAGYFKEFDQDLAPNERLQFAPGEQAPPFDADKAPRLDASAWSETRLRKANRNYALDYIRNGLATLEEVVGTDKAAEVTSLAARLIGRQFYRKVAALLGVNGTDTATYAELLLRLAHALDEPSECDVESDHTEIRQNGWRLAQGLDEVPALYEIALDGLLEGLLNVHNRFLTLTRKVSWSEGAHVWHVR